MVLSSALKWCDDAPCWTWLPSDRRPAPHCCDSLLLKLGSLAAQFSLSFGSISAGSSPGPRPVFADLPCVRPRPDRLGSAFVQARRGMHRGGACRPCRCASAGPAVRKRCAWDVPGMCMGSAWDVRRWRMVVPLLACNLLNSWRSRLAARFRCRCFGRSWSSSSRVASTLSGAVTGHRGGRPVRRIFLLIPSPPRSD